MAASTFFRAGAGIIRRHRFLTVSLAVLVGFPALCLLFIWLVLPSIILSQAEAFMLSRGGDRLTMDRLAITPLLEPRIRIENLRLTQADGSPLLAFRQLSLALSLSSLVERALVIDDIKLDGLQATLTLLPKGQLNWDSVIGAAAGSPPAKAAAPSPPPRIVLRQFALSDGQVDLSDRRASVAQSLQIKPLAITLRNISTLPAGPKGEYALSAQSSLGAQVDWRGTVSLTPLSTAGDFRMAALSLPKLAALLPLPPKLAPPQGTAALSTHYVAALSGDQVDFQLADLSVQIDGLRVTGKPDSKAWFALGHAGLDGGQFDWRAHRIAVQSITLAGGGIAANRLADGSIDLLSLLPSSPPQPASAKPKPGPGAAWHYRIDRLALTGFAPEFRDETVSPAADFALQDVTAEIKGISDGAQAAMPAHVALRLRDGGRVAADGAITAKGPSAEFGLKIDTVALAPVQPYLGSATILKLVGGTLSADGRASFSGGQGRYVGALAVQDLRIREGNDNRPFLAWKSLATDSLNASPAAIDIKELRLDGLNTALTVAKDRTVNVTEILRPQKVDAHPRPVPAAAPTAASPPPLIHIARLRVRHSQLDYADLSLALPFATHIHDLEGTVDNLSTQPKQPPVRLELAGGVDEDGSASAAGRFDLLNPVSFLDIDTAFDNIELTHLTPYLVTFAGRRIDSGKLTLHLQYKINQGQLAGDNRIILDQLTLGARVRSPEARDLPLDFAIALLKDAHGRIDLGIPIAGSLADPKFNYAQVVWKAVSNVLTRIVTSPFRALGALFGGGSGDAGDILFVAGQSSLTPPMQHSLGQVAASLNSRPNLAVTIHGTWSEADRVALRDQRLRREVADLLGLPAGADLHAITPTRPDVRPVLETLYANRYGQGHLSALMDGYRDANAGKLKESVADRGLSVLTGLLGTRPSLSAGEIGRMKGVDFHALLYQKLRDGEDMPDSALENLAQSRGAVAVAALRDAHVAPDRVIVKPPQRVSAVGHDVPLAIALSPVATTTAPPKAL